MTSKVKSVLIESAHGSGYNAIITFMDKHTVRRYFENFADAYAWADAKANGTLCADDDNDWR